MPTTPPMQDNARNVPPATAVETDVLVIGGGPAGTTAATLLARAGWRVLLLEKARHPRFHIGESLLPMNLPILERLGVLEQVRAIGVHKRGADFPLPGSTEATHVFRFERALGRTHDHAFQVRREDFDQLLFEHCRTAGVDAREQVVVEHVGFENGRPAFARARRVGGDAFEVRMRYLVDASGRDTVVGNALKLKKRSAVHQSAAVFSHFRGVPRRAGDDAGNITVDRFPEGWIWVIPLPDGVTSVGAVMSPAHLKQRRGDLEAFLLETLASAPSTGARMRTAERVAPVHATGNYSYACRRTAGRGWIMAGDAHAFIDPVFSSGVYLAMDGGEQAARVVDGALREPAREAALQRAAERRRMRGLRHFSWFIHRFTGPVMQRLFASPRNDWQLEQAVIAMLAGDVFDNRPVARRLRLFRLVYAVNALAIAPSALRGWLGRRRDLRARFAGDTLQAGNP